MEYFNRGLHLTDDPVQQPEEHRDNRKFPLQPKISIPTQNVPTNSKLLPKHKSLPLTQKFPYQPHLPQGVLLMLTGVLIGPWLDGLAKLLGQTLPVLEVAWARFSVQLMLILPFAWFRLGRNILKLGQWKLQPKLYLK